MPRNPPTARMTLATLPVLSRITSLISPIFSFASLYTLTPTTLDARHSPSLCMAALVVESILFVAVCADTAPVISSVVSNAIARHLEIMMFLHPLEKQSCDENLVPAASHSDPAGRAKRFVLRLDPDVFRLFMDGIMIAAGLAMLWNATQSG